MLPIHVYHGYHWGYWMNWYTLGIYYSFTNDTHGYTQLRYHGYWIIHPNRIQDILNLQPETEPRHEETSLVAWERWFGCPASRLNGAMMGQFRLRGATDVIAILCLVSILHFLGVPHLDPDEYIHGICSEETSQNGEPIGEPIGIYATERITVNHWIWMGQVGNTWF